MWSSLLEVCLPHMAIILLLIMTVHTQAVAGAPVEAGEENKAEEGDTNGAAEDVKAEQNDSGSTTPCWLTESYTVLEACGPCQPFHAKVLTDACSDTGFNQLIHCTESDQKVFKSCPQSREAIERSFWTFEGVVLLLGGVSCLVVFVRRRKLNHDAAERVRKQISNSA